LPLDPDSQYGSGSTKWLNPDPDPQPCLEQKTKDQGNMHDGSAAVWPNGRGDIGDESRRYLCFLVAGMFFGLLVCSAVDYLNCSVLFINNIYSIFKSRANINTI
jgi:hypothetical protein